MIQGRDDVLKMMIGPPGSEAEKAEQESAKRQAETEAANAAKKQKKLVESIMITLLHL